MNPKKAIKELRRVLKRNGKLVVSSCTINKNAVERIEQGLGIGDHFSISEHLQEWSYDELKKEIEKKGFEFIGSRGVVFNLGKGVFYLQRINKKLGLFIHKLSLSIKRFPRNSEFIVLSFKKKQNIL
ncbi:hypothetical protein A3K73_06315 [Candidatus Pacearchaeota archaeon RBG_13_36_9]|nr:MAG: hypothetical protein A3K73_06315 [Candidatus Pacearchaeota archaeon RBG_13_36_9]